MARAEREGLGRTIQYTPPDKWEAESRCAGWRNRDVVAHLAAHDVAAAQVLGGEDPTEFEEFFKAHEGESPTLDDLNEWTVRRRADVPFRQVVLEWGRAADLFLSRASHVTEEGWYERVPWITGDIPVRFLVQSRVVEWWIHGEDILVGAGLPPRDEHWPIFAVNDMAIRTLPYALGLAGLSFPGRSVRVELEGSGGGTWHYGLAPREVPREGKRPDVVIEGRAPAFSEVAARRVPADVYLDDGSLLIGGDEDLGLLILEHIRAFP